MVTPYDLIHRLKSYNQAKLTNQWVVTCLSLRFLVTSRVTVVWCRF